MLFGCRCPLVPHQHMNTPVHQTKNSWFSGPYLTSLVFRLRLLHRWLCRWHLDPNSDMQLWLQHICLHMLATNASWKHLWFYNFSLCGYASISCTATGQVSGIEWNWHVKIPLAVHDGSLAAVCEPHTALDFSAKNAESQKVHSQIYMFKLQFSAWKFSDDPQNE